MHSVGADGRRGPGGIGLPSGEAAGERSDRNKHVRVTKPQEELRTPRLQRAVLAGVLHAYCHTSLPRKPVPSMTQPGKGKWEVHTGNPCVRAPHLRLILPRILLLRGTLTKYYGFQ